MFIGFCLQQCPGFRGRPEDKIGGKRFAQLAENAYDGHAGRKLIDFGLAPCQDMGMKAMTTTLSASRRRFLTTAVAGAAGCAAARSLAVEDEHAGKALIAITLDLEMSRNFPIWEETRWDYEKGNLNDETKRYTVEACKMVKDAGGVLHCFAVGQTLEQPNVDWLAEIAQAGHPIGNHTYDHVNVLATKTEDLQFRFRRSPWLIAGRTPAQVIVDNIRLTSVALKTRIGVEAAGFRTPGGFANGLADREDARRWLRELGFTWTSSKYPRHSMTEPGREPSEDFIRQIVALQEQAQPFVYPDGLIEIPMSPVSDIGAFRTGRWKLDSFLKITRRSVESVIERRGVFDFLGHPSCLYVMDPQMKTIEMMVGLVKKSQGRVAIVDLGTIAKQVRNKLVDK